MKPQVLSLAALAIAIAVAGCSRDTSNPMSPAARALGITRATNPAAAAPLTAGGPGYEPAYVDGHTVTINAIEIGGHVAPVAQEDFYEVVYPNGWQSLGLAPPQCNPCDHDGNGIDAQDFHDHILGSEPGLVGFRAPWHVFVVVPAYNGDATHDNAVSQAYAAHLPTKSEAAVDDLLASKLAGGAPLAVKIDTQFYFLCAVVNAHAAH